MSVYFHETRNDHGIFHSVNYTKPVCDYFTIDIYLAGDLSKMAGNYRHQRLFPTLPFGLKLFQTLSSTESEISAYLLSIN